MSRKICSESVKALKLYNRLGVNNPNVNVSRLAKRCNIAPSTLYRAIKTQDDAKALDVPLEVPNV